MNSKIFNKTFKIFPVSNHKDHCHKLAQLIEKYLATEELNYLCIATDKIHRLFK
jgi:hypothetical protein